MCIKKVVLENFQSHKFSEFIFDKHLNVIVGVSNAGKTSLSRALNFILFGNFDQSFVCNGASFCKITLVMDSGVTIIREKGTKVNKYILQVPGQPDQEFSNFGLDVPEVIQRALNIRKVQLDKDDSLTLNLASQLEPLFLFNRSGSQKAKIFGRLSGAHYLDHALRSLSTEKKQTNTEKNLKTQELDNLKTQHANLSKIYDYSVDMMGFIAIEGRIEEAGQRLEALKSLFKRVRDWKTRYEAEIRKESILGQAKAVELPSFEASVQRLNALKQLILLKNTISAKENTYNTYKIQLEANLKEHTDEYLKLLGDEKLCPTCFGNLDEQKLFEIKNALLGEHKCLA